jgi:dihydropyrimidine dehydrogenase (NADP+)/dihydropyrimidine dehydrogenase (NAD+) subunit PreA
MCEELLAFMEGHGFETLGDFKGASLPYFTTHADLVRRQRERKDAEAEAKAKKMIKADSEWTGDEFVAQSDALSR